MPNGRLKMILKLFYLWIRYVRLLLFESIWIYSDFFSKNR